MVVSPASFGTTLRDACPASPLVSVTADPIDQTRARVTEPEFPLEAHLSMLATLTLRALLPLGEPSPRRFADL